MTRYAVLGVGGIVYTAAAVWLVHTQAESHRRTLRPPSRVEQSAAPRPFVPTAAVPDPATPIKTSEVISQAPAAGPEALKPAAPVPSEPPAPRPEAPAGPALAPGPAAEPPQRIEGLTELPAAEEMRLGKALHELILLNHPADEASPLRRTVTEAVRPLLDLRERKDVEVTITVLDSDAVNAFSHLGGYIYVTRGLSHLVGTDEEYRFVVGHELAHVDRRHGQARVAEAGRAGALGGVGTFRALYHQIAAGFTDEQEFEADDWVVDRLRRLGQTPRECLMFPRKLVGLSERENFANGHRRPKSGPGEGTQDVDNQIRSGPAPWTRLQRMEVRLNALTKPAPAPGSPSPAR